MTATLPQPTAGGPAADEPWYLTLLGRVGHHEAITVLAALIDTGDPVAVHTRYSMPALVRQRCAGRAGWNPPGTVLRAYCAGPLSRAGVVAPAETPQLRAPHLMVRGYQAVEVGRQRRCALYRTLIEWSLTHPAASVQQLVGVPRHGAADGQLPVQLRLPLYQTLLDADGQHVPYHQLLALTPERAERRFRQTIAQLRTARILTTKRVSHKEGGAALHPQWRRPIGELMRRLGEVAAVPPGITGQQEALATVLADPHIVAELWDKAAAYSSMVIGHRDGAARTARQVRQAVAGHREPVTARRLAQQLQQQGRPISRYRLLAYLNQDVADGRLGLVEDPEHDTDETQPPVGDWPHRFTPTDSVEGSRT